MTTESELSFEQRLRELVASEDKAVNSTSSPADESEKAEPRWEELRREFLAIENERLHREGKETFIELVNRMIAADLSIGDMNWEDLSGTNEFQAAFDFVVDRLLMQTAFAEKMRKYCETATALTPWQYMTNAVRLVLGEWNSSRRDKPSLKLEFDKTIENRTSTSTIPPTQSATDSFHFSALSHKIDELKKPHQAAIILLLWPLDTLPDQWREKFLPVIIEVAEQQGQDRQETLKRLDKTLVNRESLSEEALHELESRQARAFKEQSFYCIGKRAFAKQLQELDIRKPDDQRSVQDLLKTDCYSSVQQQAEESVKELISSDDLYNHSVSGLKKIRDHSLWLRKRFLLCCYKEKVKRRIWLNAMKELEHKRPANGPMASEEIAYILNRPKGTCDSDLSRGKAKLRGQLSNPQSHDSIDFEHELLEEHLQQYVCENLQPSAH